MTKKLQNRKMSAGLDMCAKFQVSILIKSWWNHRVKIWWLTHGMWKLIKAFKKPVFQCGVIKHSFWIQRDQQFFDFPYKTMKTLFWIIEQKSNYTSNLGLKFRMWALETIIYRFYSKGFENKIFHAH